MAFTGFNYTLPSDYIYLNNKMKLIETKKWRYAMGQKLIEYLKAKGTYLTTTESGLRICYRLKFIHDGSSGITISDYLANRTFMYFDILKEEHDSSIGYAPKYTLLQTVPITEKGIFSVTNFGTTYNEWVDFVFGGSSIRADFCRRNICDGYGGQYIWVFPDEFTYTTTKGFAEQSSIIKSKELISFKNSLQTYIVNYLKSLNIFDQSKIYKFGITSNAQISAGGASTYNTQVAIFDAQQIGSISNVADMYVRSYSSDNSVQIASFPIMGIIQYAIDGTTIEQVYPIFFEKIKLFNALFTDLFTISISPDGTAVTTTVPYINKLSANCYNSGIYTKDQVYGLSIYTSAFGVPVYYINNTMYDYGLSQLNLDRIVPGKTITDINNMTVNERKNLANLILLNLKDFIVNNVFKVLGLNITTLTYVDFNFKIDAQLTGSSNYGDLANMSSNMNSPGDINYEMYFTLYSNSGYTTVQLARQDLFTHFRAGRAWSGAITNIYKIAINWGPFTRYYDLYKLLSESGVATGTKVTSAPFNASAPSYNLNYRFMYDGRQYVGNPSLFLKPTANIPSGEYRRDEFPLVQLTNQSPSMHSFPRKYKTSNNRILNNTSNKTTLFKNIVFKNNKLYILRDYIVVSSDILANFILLEVDLNTLSTKEIIISSPHTTKFATGLNSKIKMFLFRNEIYLTGTYKYDEEDGNMCRIDLDLKQAIFLDINARGIFCPPDLARLPDDRLNYTFGLSHLDDVIQTNLNNLIMLVSTVSDVNAIVNINYTSEDYLHLENYYYAGYSGNYEEKFNFSFPGLTKTFITKNLTYQPYTITEDNTNIYGLYDSKLIIIIKSNNTVIIIDIPRIRKYGTIIVKNNIIYLLGGLGVDNEPLFCIDQYDIEKGIWLDPWDYTAAIKIEDRPSYKIQSKWVNIPNTNKYIQIHKELETDNTCISYIEIAKPTTMYYTTDGSDPKDKNNLNRVKYTGPFNIKPSGTKTTTVKVRAYTDIE